MSRNSNNLISFKKKVRECDDDSLEHLVKHLNWIQLYRRFSEAKAAFPQVNTDSPEDWLSIVVFDEILKKEYSKVLQGYPEFVSSIEAVQRCGFISELSCFDANLRVSAIPILFQERYVRRLCKHLSDFSIENVDQYVKDLRKYIGNADDLMDHAMEGQFALGFAIRGAKVKMQPNGSKGPDLFVIDNDVSSFIEISCFRRDEGLEKCLYWKDGESLKVYPDGVHEVYSKIIGKIGQLIDGQINLILLFSRHVARENIDFEIAVDQYVTNETNLGLHKALSSVIFASCWKQLGHSGLQSKVWKNANALNPLPNTAITIFHEAVDIATSLPIGCDF
jgi:hypothetical protein